MTLYKFVQFQKNGLVHFTSFAFSDILDWIQIINTYFFTGFKSSMLTFIDRIRIINTASIRGRMTYFPCFQSPGKSGSRFVNTFL